MNEPSDADQQPTEDQPADKQPGDHQAASAETQPAPGSTSKSRGGPPEYVVRFGSMRMLGVMTSSSKHSFRYGDEVVVRSNRGTEIGTVLCEATPTALDAITEPTEGRIVRRASDDDRSQWKHLQTKVAEDLETCQGCVDALGLKMELVDAERILGGERLVVYFLAEGRIDFRQLVRDLAKQFQTRIEMRQIGVRDEAKLLADYGDCGQPICCATFLSKMPPVSMKMAKLQKATLDPSKISGRCGRLKCCLRYEFDTYQSLAEQLPSPGSIVTTREGSVTVMAQDILSQQLIVKTEDNRRIMIHGEEVLSVTRRGDDPPKSKRGRSRKKSKTDTTTNNS